MWARRFDHAKCGRPRNAGMHATADVMNLECNGDATKFRFTTL
jgi:hypothetical protein